MPHGSTKAIYDIKIAPTEKGDLVKFMTDSLCCSDYPDHRVLKFPK